MKTINRQFVTVYRENSCYCASLTLYLRAGLSVNSLDGHRIEEPLFVFNTLSGLTS